MSLSFPEGLCVEDQFLCKEEEFDINEKGQLFKKKRKISFLNNLRYSFDVFARAFSIQDAPEYGSSDFQKLKNCVAIRDRLTHSKAIADLLVSADELLDMANGMAWFTREFQKVAGSGMTSLSAAVKGDSNIG